MHTHTVSPTVYTTPAGSFTSAQVSYTADTIWNHDGVVPANGATAITLADSGFVGSSIKSMVLQSTVPCVVTFNTSTSVSPTSVTLAAGIPSHITTFTGTCTSIEIGANTESSGPAGTIAIAALYDA